MMLTQLNSIAVCVGPATYGRTTTIVVNQDGMVGHGEKLEKLLKGLQEKLRITKEPRKARSKEGTEAGTCGQVEACARPAGPNLLFFRDG